MSERSFDVVVIGTGPGGEGAAMQAAKGASGSQLSKLTIELAGAVRTGVRSLARRFGFRSIA